MPFDGSGNYVPPAPPTFPAVDGTLIRSDYFNTIINDIATALSTVGVFQDNLGTVDGASLIGTDYGLLETLIGNLFGGNLVFLQSLTNGASDESSRLSTAIGILTTGQTLILSGNWLIGSKSELASVDGVTIVCTPGVVIKLVSKVWTDPAGIVIRDCKDFRLLGWPKLDCNYQSVPLIAGISTDPTTRATLASVRSERHFYQVNATRCATRAVGIRLVRGVIFDYPKALYKYNDSQFFEVARSNKVLFWYPEIDGSLETGAAQEFDIYGSGISVSPGANGNEFVTEPAINLVGPTTFLDRCRRTAPTGTPTATFSFVGDLGATTVYDPGTDFSDYTWNFICTEKPAGARDFRSSQVVVTAVNSGTKEITAVMKDDYTFADQDWEGQTLYLYGYDASRLCDDVKVVGGSIKNCSGAGSFLLGCRGAYNIGVQTENNIDIGVDLEWCLDSWNIDCQDTTPLVTGTTPLGFPIGNASSAYLYPIGGTGGMKNCQGNKKAEVIMSGEVTDQIVFENVKAPIQVGPNLSTSNPALIAKLSIKDCTIPDAVVNGMDIKGSTTTNYVKGAIKRIIIESPIFAGVRENGITLNSCQFFSVRNAEADRLGLRLVRLLGNPGDITTGEVIGSRLRGIGGVFNGLGVVMWDGVGATSANYPTVNFEDNWIQDETEAVGVNRPLYALSDGTVLPAYRRGQGKITWDGGAASIAVGAVSAWSSNISISGARLGIDVIKAQPSVPMNFIVESELTADGVGRIRLRNVSAGAATPASADYIYQVDFR